MRHTLTVLAMTLLATTGLQAAATGGANATDLPSRSPLRVLPSIAEPEAARIWGAIAFSPATGHHGFFWGGATRAEATTIALGHCADAGGSQCKIVSQFSSYRDRWAPHLLGPVPMCGALSVVGADPRPEQGWGAASGPTRFDAERLAIQRCGDPRLCTIREWVCT